VHTINYKPTNFSLRLPATCKSHVRSDNMVGELGHVHHPNVSVFGLHGSECVDSVGHVVRGGTRVWFGHWLELESKDGYLFYYLR
jgi:hypothetical protein